MAFRIAILGDIVGAPGCMAVQQSIEFIREQWQADLVIANAENAANGSGLTPRLYKQLCAAGVDGLTLGDHVYKKQQIINTLKQETNLIRPANLPIRAAGKGWMKLPLPRTANESNSSQPTDVYVITVLGRLYINLPGNDPFATVDQILDQIPQNNSVILVEVHAEATSEKQALGWYLNGRVAAVYGTHTHVATADARILPNPDTAGDSSGTAYITDLGMCGPHDSVLGRKVDRVVAHMSTSMPSPFDVAEGNPRVQGICIQIDPCSGRSTRIDRLDLKADTTKSPF